MSNPYLLPEDDTAAVVGEQKNSSSGSTEEETPNATNSRHAGAGLGGEELPEDVQKALGRYLTIYQPENINQPIEFRALRQLFEFFATFPTYATSGTLLLSIAEVVDEMSDGMLQRVYTLHEAERKMIWTRSILDFEEFVYSILHFSAVQVHDAYEAEIALYFEVLLDIVKWYDQVARKEYLTACEELGREPDDEFLATGTLSERTHFQKIGLGHPPAKRDV